MYLPDPEASHALLVGVSKYSTLEDLEPVENNLAGLQQVFADQSLWGLPVERCTVLSQPPSAEFIIDEVKRVSLLASDTLVVYYAGHGLTDPVSDELYLALPNSGQDRLHAALPYEWVRRAILHPSVRARRKIVILDCCYSGRALIGKMGAAIHIGEFTQIEGSYLLTAAAETRVALAPPDERYTAFTGELIAILESGIHDGPALLDMDTVYRHLDSALAAKGRPRPQQRNRNSGGLVALARNRVGMRPARQATIQQGVQALQPIAILELDIGPLQIFDEVTLLRIVELSRRTDHRRREPHDE